MFIAAGSSSETMRFILRAQIPTEAGNRMMQNPKGLDEVEAHVRNIKAEAVYFLKQMETERWCYSEYRAA